jgi:crossover junction endodeoxyribonuclease RuvC
MAIPANDSRRNNDRIILGVDPGTNILGFGVIAVTGNAIRLLDMGVLKLDKIADHPQKLQRIFREVERLSELHLPDEFAIEAPFFGKNVQSMLKLGRAQGVAIAASINRNIPVFEYSPRKIKQSITGNGNASKEQVAAMLHSLLKFQEKPEFLDATDGLAVAVCHFFQNKMPTTAGKSKDWSAFIKNNPGRIKGG